MLYTNLKHIETEGEFSKIINQNPNVMIICGSMTSNCISIYNIAEELENEFKNVEFFDMEFDNPESEILRKIPEITDLMTVPLTIFYKNGNVVKVTDNKQNKKQIINILNEYF